METRLLALEHLHLILPSLHLLLQLPLFSRSLHQVVTRFFFFLFGLVVHIARLLLVRRGLFLLDLRLLGGLLRDYRSLLVSHILFGLDLHIIICVPSSRGSPFLMRFPE